MGFVPTLISVYLLLMFILMYMFIMFMYTCVFLCIFLCMLMGETHNLYESARLSGET